MSEHEYEGCIGCGAGVYYDGVSPRGKYRNATDGQLHSCPHAFPSTASTPHRAVETPSPSSSDQREPK